MLTKTGIRTIRSQVSAVGRLSDGMNDAAWSAAAPFILLPGTRSPRFLAARATGPFGPRTWCRLRRAAGADWAARAAPSGARDRSSDRSGRGCARAVATREPPAVGAGPELPPRIGAEGLRRLPCPVGIPE